MDSPRLDSWRLVTDLGAPVGSDHGPFTTPAGCAVASAVKGALWAQEHVPGWRIVEVHCVPVREIATFLARRNGPEI